MNILNIFSFGYFRFATGDLKEAMEKCAQDQRTGEIEIESASGSKSTLSILAAESYTLAVLQTQLANEHGENLWNLQLSVTLEIIELEYSFWSQ